MTNSGVRQEFIVFPTLFNNYIEDLVRNWKTEDHQGVQMDRNCNLNVMMYAHDVVILQNSEYYLQRFIIHRMNWEDNII